MAAPAAAPARALSPLDSQPLKVMTPTRERQTRGMQFFMIEEVLVRIGRGARRGCSQEFSAQDLRDDDGELLHPAQAIALGENLEITALNAREDAAVNRAHDFRGDERAA